MKVSVFAVDVGYGNTKSAFRMGSDIVTRMFPSVAPKAVDSALTDNGHGVIKPRKVATIKVGNSAFEIGPGVELSVAHGDAGRNLTNDFCTTDKYAALLGGALHFADIEEVDRLVLGLPLHTIKKHSDHLRDAFTGTFDFGHKPVRIKSVKVVPQPLGALVSFAEYGGVRFDHDNAHLVVDVGYFTTDWVVANGFTVNDRRSGGSPGAASHIYQNIADLLEKAETDSVRVERIDKSLREKKPLLVFDKEIDLAPYLEASEETINHTVAQIQKAVGAADDLRSIVLTGGGAYLFETAIRAQFPRTRVEVLQNPSYSNVKGFQIVGEVTLARESKAMGAAA